MPNGGHGAEYEEEVDEIISLPLKEDTEHAPGNSGFGLFKTKGKRSGQENAETWKKLSKKTLNSLTPTAIGHRLWTTFQILQENNKDEFEGSTASKTVYDGKGSFITATAGMR